jgi:hypothetical protein
MGSYGDYMKSYGRSMLTSRNDTWCSSIDSLPEENLEICRRVSFSHRIDAFDVRLI